MNIIIMHLVFSPRVGVEKKFFENLAFDAYCGIIKLGGPIFVNCLNFTGSSGRNSVYFRIHT